MCITSVFQPFRYLQILSLKAHVHFGGLTGGLSAPSSRTVLPVVFSLCRASEHFAPHLDKSPRDAQRDIHLRRSGSGWCFIAFMVSALKGNFSTSESRVTQVIESRCEAALPYTVCWLAFRCAPRGHKPRLVS